jgi:DNA-binding transcriptional MerR regulator
MEKLYYSISEVSKIVDEEQHILRYWEKEFGAIKPRKNRAGNRVYSTRDLAIIKIVKDLLRVEKLSLKGAKEKIKEIDLEKIEDGEITDSKKVPIIVSQSQSGIDNQIKNGTFVFEAKDLIEIRSLLTDFRNYLVT